MSRLKFFVYIDNCLGIPLSIYVWFLVVRYKEAMPRD
jgi:hypothetical protein